MGTSKETSDILTNVITAEGGEKATNRPNDRGGRTQFGISERANPEAWLDGKVTEPEAREIYERKYVKTPHFDQITDSRLQAQLVDFGVTSGPQLAIQKLQGLVGVEPDGILGPVTLAKVNAADATRLNNQLALERIKMMGRLIHKDPRQVENINGWLARFGGFFRF